MSDLNNPLAPLIAELAKFGGFTEEKATELADILLPYIDEYASAEVDKIVEAALRKLQTKLPKDENVTKKYGYHSDEKKYGYRLAITDVFQLMTDEIEQRKRYQALKRGGNNDN